LLFAEQAGEIAANESLWPKCDPDCSILDRTAAALAQPEPQGPSDKELLELMPEAMRDEFSYAARTCSDAMGGRVKPSIFRVALNTAALEYAQAVLQRYGRPAIESVPVSERLPGPEDCDAEGRCWMCGKVEGDWRLISTDNPGVPQLKYAFSHWLPHWALPVLKQAP
jgi:hypothetical protein